jgi:hypothetical protein
MNIVPVSIARRKIGIEPREVDLVVASSALTAADRQELSAFFRDQRRQNDQRPAVVALRKHLKANR